MNIDKPTRIPKANDVEVVLFVSHAGTMHIIDVHTARRAMSMCMSNVSRIKSGTSKTIKAATMLDHRYGPPEKAQTTKARLVAA
ncbi:hypothetical protein MAUB1S_09653 [Mycolicibacterium aubagnense]